VLTCRNLIPYKNVLNDPTTTYDGAFIARIPGLEFKPYPFSSFNVKHAWASPAMNDSIRKYIYTLLKVSLDICKDVYDLITSPDVDVKEFSKIIISSIAQVRKMIPRCDDAFNKIEESVALLEGRFGTYYKDFIQSKNPSTIIESFVIDVSNSGGADKRLAFQFKKIVAYYRKATQGKIKDPKLKKIFDMLQSNFDVMDNADAQVEAMGPKDGETIVVDEREEDGNDDDAPRPISKSAKRRARAKRAQERKRTEAVEVSELTAGEDGQMLEMADEDVPASNQVADTVGTAPDQAEDAEVADTAPDQAADAEVADTADTAPDQAADAEVAEAAETFKETWK